MKYHFGYKEKIVIKNSLYIYILNFFCTIMPIFTIPYATRVLGPKGYGRFSVAFNLVNYFQVLVEYGFVLYGSRKVAIAKTKEEIREIFSLIFKARMLLCAASLILISIYGIIFVNKNYLLCIVILFLMVIGSMFQQNWLFQGMQKMEYITGISVFSRLISLILIFTLVKVESDVYLYCFLYALTNFLIGVGGFIIAKKTFQLKLIKVTYSQIVNELKEASYMFMSILGAKIVSSFGITILGIMDTASNIGIYSAICKIPNVIVMMFSPISQALYPYISKKFMLSMKAGINTVLKIAIPVVSIFIFISIGMAIFSNQIVKMLFGNEYSEHHVILKILMIWIVFSVINNFLGIQTLTASNNGKQYGKGFLISVIIAVISNVILVKFIGIYGAAVALLLSEAGLTMILAISIFTVFKKCTEIKA